jgi:hypothetical protein
MDIELFVCSATQMSNGSCISILQKKGSFWGPVVGEDQKWILNSLSVVLPKCRMGLVFWVPLLERV